MAGGLGLALGLREAKKTSAPETAVARGLLEAGSTFYEVEKAKEGAL